MNAKKAKALRKVLRNLMSSEDGLKLQEGTYVEDVSRRKLIEVQKKQEDGTTKPEKVTLASGTIRNAKDSRRGVYRMLKQELKQVERRSKALATRPLIQDIEQISVPHEPKA